ncbi:MAG TPA: TetR/AcrR family transcriptional regulator [Spirochaetota bacterium]|nr:TetR/AcrR family transcriptional regulator [Spirochaetota bacterium]HRZ26365.1 TetR/AcrR family transcriptional regulator [Spirochaetota bacterium]HSA13331.1 TetR/AcrR family transcriptional regulator [Spirochaetota bacterium]
MPPKGERRKLQIINTAKDMFINEGFQSTHIGQVCEKLNIARGTVYQYFSNKKEILYAILDSVIEEIEDILDPDDLSEFLGHNEDPQKIKKFIHKRIAGTMSVLVNEPIVIKLIFKDIVGIDEEVAERVNISVMSLARIISAEIAELKDKKIYKDSVDPQITASMLIGGVMMIVYEYEKKKRDVQDSILIDSIADNYLSGVVR